LRRSRGPYSAHQSNPVADLGVEGHLSSCSTPTTCAVHAASIAPKIKLAENAEVGHSSNKLLMTWIDGNLPNLHVRAWEQPILTVAISSSSTLLNRI
jgi:hypothetical protein